MSKQTKEIKVFDYTDYRKYLLDYYNFRKKTDKIFSYRFFAQKAKFNSSGLYKEIVDGKRSLTRTLIAKFSTALKHGKREAEYFENMVLFNEAKSTEEKKLLYDNLKKIKFNWKIQVSELTTLRVRVVDRVGLFADILNIFSSMDINVESLNTKTAKENLFMIFEFRKLNDAKTDELINKIKRVRNVLEVRAV